jgi:hypothetical protein
MTTEPTLKKLTVLTNFQHTHDGDTSPTRYVKGETVYETPRMAKYFCGASWCKDESGEFKTGEPNKHVELQPDDVLHDTGTAGP